MKLLFALVLVVGSCCFGGAAGAQQQLDPRLRDFDIANLVRFKDAKQAEARRDQMVRFIWPNGLPTSRPKVSKGIGDQDQGLATVKQALIGRVDRYQVNVSKFDFQSTVLVAHPKQATSKRPRLAIVHAGHMPKGPENYLAAGLADTVDHLLQEGFVVAVVQMPLVAWNHDKDGVLPSGKAFSVSRRGTAGHDALFETVEPELKGGTLRFFLEPVVQATNELLATNHSPELLLMIGLSGGGWTTHLSAAVDPRIDVSIPVAGALPLYARPFSRGSKGDAEQEYAPLYREIDSNQDGIQDKATGVASWLEIFALGGLSPRASRPRLAVQVLNLYDTCCFGGPVYKSYGNALAARVEAIGTGRWSVHSDDTHRSHVVSRAVLDNVLPKALKDWATLNAAVQPGS